MQYLCKLVCPKGGVILDPFGGSFTTAIAAWNENMACWSIEKEREYFEKGVDRVKRETGKYPLF
jgi:DNA modification methylase